MTKRFILDSGAFTVWTQGASIDLDEYINFCLKFPDVSYYVNLDVIPGTPNKKRTLTPDNIQKACFYGWQNYHRMIDKLPKDKVIPVYHQNDPVSWLEDYIKAGVSYIGISPANDCTTEQKIKWMKSFRSILFDSAGRPVVKTHGFAVTSYELMKYWEWYSVDSASWKLNAAWGGVYLPKTKNNEWIYDRKPFDVAVSPMSPKLAKRQHHAVNMTPNVRELVNNWLDECGLDFGKSEVVQKNSSYKLSREENETWYDKKKYQVLRVIERGVSNNLEDRLKVNSLFIKRANKILPIEHIYFAGAPMPYPLEYKLNNRLLSYHILGKGNSGSQCLEKHLALIRK